MLKEPTVEPASFISSLQPLTSLQPLALTHVSLHLLFFFLFLILFFNFTILYWFCHISIWTCAPILFSLWCVLPHLTWEPAPPPPGEKGSLPTHYLPGTVLSIWFALSHVQFSWVTQLCSTLCDPMDCSTPGFPVYHQLPELTQTHVHWVGDAI